MLHEPELSKESVEISLITRFGDLRVDLDITVDEVTGEQFVFVPLDVTESVDVSDEAYDAIENIVNWLHNCGYDALRRDQPLEVKNETFVAQIRYRSLELA